MDNSLDYDFRIPVHQRAIKPKPIIRNHHDWKIHKILDEARRVYICPARGNCKPERTLRMYKELLEEGKKLY